MANLSVRNRSCGSVPDEDSRKDVVTRATDEKAILSQGKMRVGFSKCGNKIQCSFG